MDMIRDLCYQLATKRRPIGFARLGGKVALVIGNRRYLDSTENILTILRNAQRGKN